MIENSYKILDHKNLFFEDIMGSYGFEKAVYSINKTKKHCAKLLFFNLKDDQHLAEFYESMHEHYILKRLSGIVGFPHIYKNLIKTSFPCAHSLIIMDRYREIENEKASDVFNFCIEPIEQMHRFGIYHNDLSPWNIMKSKSEFKIIDFNGANFGLGTRYSFVINRHITPSVENDVSMLAVSSVIIENNSFRAKSCVNIDKTMSSMLSDGTILDLIDSINNKKYQVIAKKFLNSIYKKELALPIWMRSGGKAGGISPMSFQMASIKSFPV